MKQKHFVNYNAAIALKQAGYNIPQAQTFVYWNNGIEDYAEFSINDHFFRNEEMNENECVTMSLSEAISWLEGNDIFIDCHMVDYGKYHSVVNYCQNKKMEGIFTEVGVNAGWIESINKAIEVACNEYLIVNE